jgi:hypothetical protein
MKKKTDFFNGIKDYSKELNEIKAKKEEKLNKMLAYSMPVFIYGGIAMMIITNCLLWVISVIIGCIIFIGFATTGIEI